MSTEQKPPMTADALLDAVVKEHGAGERRPQQEKMVHAVENALTNNENLIVQAGTGVGKSLGYLVPVVADGARTVISTATKQLSEQIANQDIPFLQKVCKEQFGKTFSASILKGRSNYVCVARLKKETGIDGDPNQGSLDLADDNEVNDGAHVPPAQTPDFDTTDEAYDKGSVVDKAKITSAQIAAVAAHIENNKTTGDRSDVPKTHNKVWELISATPQQCVGASTCPFSAECYSEAARAQARSAQVVITNHHLAATDLPKPPEYLEDEDEDTPGWQILGDRDVVVFDEVHELDGAISGSWGTTVTPGTLSDFTKMARKIIPASMSKGRTYLNDIDDLTESLKTALDLESEPRRITAWDGTYETTLKNISSNLQKLISVVSVDSVLPPEGKVEVSKNAERIHENIDLLLATHDTDYVIWIAKEFEKASLNVAPLRSGPELQSRLSLTKTKMIATSATITVNGSFEIPMRNMAMDESIYPTQALDVGTPFNYPKQGILYIPRKGDFPEPVGKDRFEHKEAVLEALLRITKAAGGRTLALSVTTAGAKSMAEFLRANLTTPVLSQFDGAPGVIAQQFADDEQSTLCATMGMWHGLNVPGKSLSAVVIDKVPFPPFNEPLLNARKEDVERNGGNGFMDVYVASATVMLAQGVGRLVRHTTDRGVVAVLDPRLLYKGYGRAVIKSLPPMWLTSDEDATVRALSRLISEE